MAGPELVLYDGSCGMCHASVRFALAHDSRSHFRFAPLSGSTAADRLSPSQRAALPDSLVVLTERGELLTRSAAVLHLWSQLERPWPAIARFGRWIPRSVRDLAYRALARTRRGWSAQPAGPCPLVPPDLARRLLP